MKIRKTFAGNLPDNKIVNSNSTSETDTYSCKYLNERNVIVSSEEPTTGEEVWLQRSGNLFDKNNYNLWNGWINESNNTFTANSKGYLVYIPCSPNTTYIVSREVLEANFKVGVADKTPINQGTLTNVINNPYGNSIIITSGANDKYLYIYIHYTDDTTDYTLEQILDSLRVEIPKKIYTKTDNGYEEFYNEENREVYSTSEQRIGTYLGKPLYRKVLSFGNLETGAIEHNIPNVEHIHFGAGTGAKRTDGFFAYNTYYNDNDFVMFLVNNQSVHFSIGSVTRISGVIFVLEYTKTTD